MSTVLDGGFDLEIETEVVCLSETDSDVVMVPGDLVEDAVPELVPDPSRGTILGSIVMEDVGPALFVNV